MWLQIYCFLYSNKIVFCINVKNLTRKFYYIGGPTLLKSKSMKKIHLISILIAIACNSPETNSIDVIEIDFQYIKQKIIIPVEIDNEIYQFCLDTGSRTSISNDLRNKLIPKVEYEANILDGNGNNQIMETVLLDSLNIGGIGFSKINALTYDFGKIFGCFEHDGYIGSDLLLDYIVQIDLDTKKIRLTRDPGLLKLDPLDAQEMVLIGDQGSPYVWIEFDQDKTPFKDFVMVDTGMYGIYDLSLDTYERLLKNQKINLLAKSEGAATVGAFGIGEKRDQFLFHFPSLRVGNFNILNYIHIGTHASTSRIGSELLEHGIMTLDFINEKFYFNSTLEHFQIEQTKPYFYPTYQDEKLIVGIVWDEKLKSKIQFGDQILEVNGKDLTELDFCDLVLGPSQFKKDDLLNIKFRREKDSIFTLELKKEKMVFID